MILRARKVFVVLMLLLLCAVFPYEMSAQVENRKIGKPTKEELGMAVYAADSSAAAVVLYKETYVDYDWMREDFQVTYKYKRRIKILKEEGLDYANGEILYIDKKGRSERVMGLEASSYNLNDGKVVRTKMKDENVYTERLSENVVQIKYAVPQVRVGSVVEIEYKIVSDYYYQPRDWYAQEEIPVRLAELTMLIPEFITFNIENHGHSQLSVSVNPVNTNMSIGSGLMPCAAEERKYVGEYLPAIGGEPYVWCPQDYFAQVNMEFKGYEIPGLLHQTYSGSWEQIDKALFEDADFGGRMKATNPLRAEMNALRVDTLQTVEAKTAALFALLKSRVRWNGKYALFGKGFKEVLKDGTGDNADINFMLISMLADAGIESYPVVMSCRDEKALPYSHPSIERLSTFVVAVIDGERIMYVDASSEYGYVDILSPRLMTNRARLMIPGNSQWVSLQQVGSHSMSRKVQAKLGSDGRVEGVMSTYYYGIEAADKREAYFAAKDSADYVKTIGELYDIEVTSYNNASMGENTSSVREVIGFAKNADVNGEYIYLNPMLFAHVESSPFISEKRELPVEFPNQYKYTMNVLLDIPQGYVLEDKPESGKITLSDNGASLLYSISQMENKVVLKYVFDISKMIYLPSDYPELKWFWDNVAEKNNAMLVLKKH